MNGRVFPTLLDLVRADLTASPGAPFTPGDFSYRWHTEIDPGVAPRLRIWRDRAGNARAFAWLSDGILHLVHHREEEPLLEEMLGWGEAAARTVAVGSGSLRVMVDACSGRLGAMLAGRGYRAGELTLVRYVRVLENSLPPVTLPPRYLIHHVDGDRFDASWATAYGLAFGPEMVSLDRRRALARSPLYQPELDLVASSPDGTVAAFSLVWLDPVTGSGTFEPVGCVPAHRRRGLSRALMAEGLRRLRERGVEKAYVTTALRRAPANRLYAALDFREVSRSHEWLVSR
jgi:ribosomal protein S18 acetylase RimI-like enzyme